MPNLPNHLRISYRNDDQPKAAHQRSFEEVRQEISLDLFEERKQAAVRHYVTHLLNEEEVNEQLEVFGLVGLNGKGPKDPMDRGPGQIVRFGSSPYAPVYAARRLALECVLELLLRNAGQRLYL